MAQHNSTNAADMNNEYFPVRIQIKSSHVNYQDQNQEVIKLRVVNNVHQPYREVTDRCRTTLKGPYINDTSGWKGQEIKGVAIVGAWSNEGYCSDDGSSRPECRGCVGAGAAEERG